MQVEDTAWQWTGKARRPSSAAGAVSRAPVLRLSRHGLDVAIYRHHDALDALDADWRDLAARVPTIGFFASPDWASAWRDCVLDETDDIILVAVRKSSLLVTVLPLVIQRFGPHRTGALIGSGSGQYGELLIDSGTADEAELHDALWAGICAAGVDAVVFDTVRSGSSLDRFISGRRFFAGAPRWAVDVDLSRFATADDYMASRSSNLRKNLRRRRRKLGEQGAVAYRVIDREEEIPEAVERVVAMKLDWLADKGLHGRFLARDDVVPWLADVATRALRVGALHFSVLEFGQKIVAAQLGFLSSDRLTGYLAAFDLEYAPFAAGKLHLEDHVADIAGDGRILDLMAPDDAYKREWGVPSHTVRSYRVPVSSLGHAVSIVHNPRLRDRLKATYMALPHRWRARVAAYGLGAIEALKRGIAQRRPVTNFTSPKVHLKDSPDD